MSEKAPAFLLNGLIMALLAALPTGGLLLALNASATAQEEIENKEEEQSAPRDDLPVRRPEIVAEPEKDQGSPADSRADPATDPPNEAKPPVETSEEPPPEPEPETEPEPEPEPEPPKKEPGDELFDYANLLWGQKFYDMAEINYRTYYANYSKGQHAEEALYRLALCHMKLQKTDDATAACKKLIRNFTGGRFVSQAAYIVGAFAYNEQRYGYAAPYFRITASRARQPEMKVKGLYYQARCLQLDDQTKSAHLIYDDLVEITEKNAYWHKGLLALGRLEAQAGKQEKALLYFSRLAEERDIERIVGAIDESGSASEEWKSRQQQDLIEAIGEATVKAGLLYSETGSPEKAVALYTRMLHFGSAAEWKALARFGLIRLHYKATDYQKVVDTFEKQHSSVALPDNTRPQMLIMVAKSYHELKQYSNAIDAYGLIERNYPEAKEATEAGYQKLRCQFILGDPTLPAYAQRFIEKQRNLDAKSEFIDMAYFLMSEVPVKQQKYGDAAVAYRHFQDGKNLESIPAEHHAMVEYKAGWAEAEAGNASEAITALSTFLANNPKSAHLPNALAKRAMSYKALEDFTSCLKDFDRIIRQFPESEPAELAYQQKGLISGQRREDQQMVATFEEMLEKFPNTSAKSQALFWIGFGKYRQKEYKECVAPLSRARELNAEAYLENASRAIIHAQYRNAQSVTSASGNEFIPKLVSEIEYYRNKKPETALPTEILFWLGMKLFDQENFAKAASFLSLASTPDSPETSQLILWERLAIARIEIGEWDLALSAAEHQFAQSKSPAAEAKALLSKARALTGKALTITGEDVTDETRKDLYDQARVATREGSKRQKEGRVGAMLILQLGDIEFAQENFEEAAELYIVPATTFDDPEITPTALWKTVQALTRELNSLPAGERSGDRGQGLANKKTELESELTKRYPTYKAPKEA